MARASEHGGGIPAKQSSNIWIVVAWGPIPRACPGRNCVRGFIASIKPCWPTLPILPSHQHIPPMTSHRGDTTHGASSSSFGGVNPTHTQTPPTHAPTTTNCNRTASIIINGGDDAQGHFLPQGRAGVRDARPPGLGVPREVSPRACVRACGRAAPLACLVFCVLLYVGCECVGRSVHARTHARTYSPRLTTPPPFFTPRHHDTTMTGAC